MSGKMLGDIETCEHGHPVGVPVMCSQCAEELAESERARKERESTFGTAPRYAVTCKHNWPAYNPATCPDCLNEETEHLKEKSEGFDSPCICGAHPAPEPDERLKAAGTLEYVPITGPGVDALDNRKDGEGIVLKRKKHVYGRVYGPAHLGLACEDAFKMPDGSLGVPQDGDSPAAGTSEPQKVENAVQAAPKWAWTLEVTVTRKGTKTIYQARSTGEDRLAGHFAKAAALLAGSK